MNAHPEMIQYNYAHVIILNLGGKTDCLFFVFLPGVVFVAETPNRDRMPAKE